MVIRLATQRLRKISELFKFPVKEKERCNIIEVKVCDAIMGSGKTEAAITYMNEHKDKKFIYVTPYLAESNRIKVGCPELHFVEPSNRLSEYHFKKIEHTAALIKAGENITTTHAALRNYTRETLSEIKEKGYTIIIDESLEVLSESDLKSTDVKMLTDSGFLKSDGLMYQTTNKVYDEGKFEEEMKMFRSRSVVSLERGKGEKFYYWSLAPELLTSFDEVFVLTYLFSGQSLCYFMKANNIPYRYIGVSLKDGVYRFADNAEYIPEYTHHIKDLIHIVEHPKLNRIGDKTHALSMNWYQSRKAVEDGELKVVKNHISNCYKHIWKDSKPSERMWGTYKSACSKIKGKGYTKGFVIFNERATNSYINKRYLAYAVNIFMNVGEKRVYEKFGVEVDQDMYALSTMLQWIWRSAIRRGEEIWVYVPSKRMRTLLKDWMERVQNGDKNNDDYE